MRGSASEHAKVQWCPALVKPSLQVTLAHDMSAMMRSCCCHSLQLPVGLVHTALEVPLLVQVPAATFTGVS